MSSIQTKSPDLFAECHTKEELLHIYHMHTLIVHFHTYTFSYLINNFSPAYYYDNILKPEE